MTKQEYLTILINKEKEFTAEYDRIKQLPDTTDEELTQLNYLANGLAIAHNIATKLG